MAMQAREFMLVDVVVLAILIYAGLGKIVAHTDEDRGQRAGQHHAPEQLAPVHAVDPAHLDELRIDRADAVQGVGVNGEEHAERHEEELGPLVDAEPQDHQLFWRVVLPGALPSIFVGVRYALGIMWLTLIVAETISA
jgi:hypothetical protein